VAAYVCRQPLFAEKNLVKNWPIWEHVFHKNKASKRCNLVAGENLPDTLFMAGWVISGRHCDCRLIKLRHHSNDREGHILLKNSKILQSYFFAIEVKYRKPLPKLLPLTHRSIRLAMIEI
jgi:hypothetical protein